MYTTGYNTGSFDGQRSTQADGRMQGNIKTLGAELNASLSAVGYPFGVQTRTTGRAWKYWFFGGGSASAMSKSIG